MQPAPMFTCPNCGGPVSAGALACDHCGAELATVRCARCYHMNPPHNVHCAGCGAELGLEPIGEHSSLRCPHCAVALETFRGGPGSLWDCSRCGGQFVEHALLSDLLERREVRGAFSPRAPSRRNPVSQPVRYVACPVCAKLMNRKNFGTASGVIVDICRDHGTWFDRGELPAVLDFAECGGLARARRAMEEHFRDESAQHAMSSAQSIRFDDTSGSARALLDGIGEAGVALAAFVRDLLDR